MLIPLQSKLSFCYFSEHVWDLKLGLWLELSHRQVTEQDLAGPCHCALNAATAEQVMLQESQAANPRPSFDDQFWIWVRSPDNPLHTCMLLSYTALFFFWFLKAIYLVNTLLFHLPIIFSWQKDQRCNGNELVANQFILHLFTWPRSVIATAVLAFSCCNQREHWLISDGHNHMKKGDTCLSWMWWW